MTENRADDRYDRQPRVMGATKLSDSTADLGMGLHVDEPIDLDSNAYIEYFGRRGDSVEITRARASHAFPWLNFAFCCENLVYSTGVELPGQRGRENQVQVDSLVARWCRIRTRSAGERPRVDLDGSVRATFALNVISKSRWGRTPQFKTYFGG
jgi:hypothetical protein